MRAVGRPALNLDALDTATTVERDRFDLTDRIAEQVQRAVRHVATDRRGWNRYRPDPTDRQNRNGRTTTLSDPCPWCAGILTGRTKPYVTCDR